MIIAKLKEGEKVNATFLIAACQKQITTTGQPYLSITLQDSSGKIEAKKWDAGADSISFFTVGKVALIKGDIVKHKNALQIRINDFDSVDEDSCNIEDFYPASPVDEENLINKLATQLDLITDQELKTVADYFFHLTREVLPKASAAVKLHHAYRGGLIHHLTSMIDVAMTIANFYPFLDKDYLIVGAFLHDLGKLEELSNNIVPSYSLRGKLVGHISIFHAQLVAACKKLNISEEKMILLEHLVLAHHGKLEHGSPVKPQTAEAYVLHIVDALDADLNALENALKETKSGEFSARLFQLDDTYFFKK